MTIDLVRIYNEVTEFDAGVDDALKMILRDEDLDLSGFLLDDSVNEDLRTSFYRCLKRSPEASELLRKAINDAPDDVPLALVRYGLGSMIMGMVVGAIAARESGAND